MTRADDEMPGIRHLFQTVAVLLCAGAACAAAEVSGFVRSASGQPLEGVAVTSPPSLRGGLKTSADGSFKLRTHGGHIFFRHPDFRPLTKIVSGSKKNLVVTLEDAAATRWDIPPCAGESDGRQGRSLRLLPPAGGKVIEGSGAHYAFFHLSYKVGKGHVQLDSVESPDATLGYPTYHWVLTSKELAERSWRSGKESGLDIRGRSRDGTYWRFVGRFGLMVSYQDASAEGAALLDRILSGACFQARAR
jgi:hypothetical protein